MFIVSGAGVVSVQLGQTRIENTDGDTPLQSTAQVTGVEYDQFFKLDRSFFVGYRQAVDATSRRNAYFAAYSGLRLYTTSVGHPIEDTVLDHGVAYDTWVKPFVEGTVAAGRALYKPVTPGGATELAADVVGLGVGTGVTVHPLARWAIDLRVAYEVYQAQGGTADSLNLSGTNLFTLVGTGFLF